MFHNPHEDRYRHVDTQLKLILKQTSEGLKFETDLETIKLQK